MSVADFGRTGSIRPEAASDEDGASDRRTESAEHPTSRSTANEEAKERIGNVCYRGCPNIEDHSQIVRFVSSFISDSLMGKVRAGAFMGVVLPSYVGIRQQKCGLTPT
jgi:hypothetical protein